MLFRCRTKLSSRTCTVEVQSQCHITSSRRASFGRLYLVRVFSLMQSCWHASSMNTPFQVKEPFWVPEAKACGQCNQSSCRRKCRRTNPATK